MNLRANLENSILEDNNYFKKIIKNLPEYIYWKDANLTYQGCNNNSNSRR
jgi:hypothetical protein